ncbi:hypothetical protein SBOR_3730 [Sclerotinia borealis F-4128]|uniref:Carrier domain-containing protein n=1 Tax=Sclerotinia borealis (strain F-4128) TaxID=1432307 RepID=W9CGS4_SCLBF|nr:hypothetical protein SBOR_3730 [Sclerotinia borealis F-4128]
MSSVPALNLNHFICTLGEAKSRKLTPVNEYDTVNGFFDYHAEHNGEELAIAIPEKCSEQHFDNASTSNAYTDHVKTFNGNGSRGISIGELSSARGSEDSTRWNVQFYSFRELRAHSLKLARILYRPERYIFENRATEHQKCIGLVGRSDQGFLLMWLALMRLGVSVLIIMPSCTSEAVQHLCKQCNVNIVFYDSTLLEHHAEASRLRKASNPSFTMRQYTGRDIVKQLKRPERTHLTAPRMVTANDIAYFHHTSGTSGLPKPIPYSHHAACGILPILHGRNTMTFTTTPLFTGGIADCFRAWTSLSTICLAPDDGQSLTSELIIKYFSQAQHGYKILTPGLSDPLRKSMYFSCVPMIAQMLSQTARGLAFLRTMDIVGVGGATLPKQTGDFLVSMGVNLVSRLGSAECSFVLSSHRNYDQDKDWEYLRVPNGVPYLKFEPLDDDSGRFELVIRNGWPQMAKRNRDDGSWATNDLFEPHPSIKNAWKIVSRRDAQITLLTGKKFDPIFIEEAIKRFPLVKDAFIFGNRQVYPGIIIFKSETAAFTDDESFRDMIWPYVEDLNNKIPSHAKLFKDMLVIKTDTHLLAKTEKGTTKRGWAEIYYDADIKDAYKNKAIVFNGEVSLETVMDIVKKAIGTPTELQYDSDFRVHHIDSVQATRIRSHLTSAFSSASKTKSFPWNLVYQCGSVRALTEYIKASQDESIHRDDEDESEAQRMISIVKHYGNSLMDDTTEACTKFDGTLEETIIITGVTGTLGVNIVSVLQSLLASRNALRIVCFVRAKNDKEAHGRVEEALRYHGLYHQETAAKLECRAVKLDQTELGLLRDVLLDLRQYATTIIHAAWEVNFSIPLKDFTEQFQGLRNLINFSLSGKSPKHLVFCSSTASLAKADIDTTMAKTIAESVNRNPLLAGPLGYSKSKWVAEVICSLACQKTRANISILRIGQLSGNTINGTWNMKEAWPLMLSTGAPGCLDSLPKLDVPLSWLPVDIAASGVIDVALRKTCERPLLPPPAENEAVVFHLVNNSTKVTWEHLLKWIGHEKKTEEFGNWLQRAELPGTKGGLRDEHPARSLLGFWKDMDGNNKNDSSAEPSFGLFRTRQVSPVMRAFTDVDAHYVRKIWLWVQTVVQRWEDEEKGKQKKQSEDEGISGVTSE